ncbi:MAG: aldehyde dehydrogenase family protein [Anaerolineae bacterium]
MYVQAGIYHQFLERLAAGAAKLKVGPGRDPASFMGPLVNGRLFEKSLRHVEDALERGATLRLIQRLACNFRSLITATFCRRPSWLRHGSFHVGDD